MGFRLAGSGFRLAGSGFASGFADGSSVVPVAKEGFWFRDDFANDTLSVFTAIGAGTIAQGGAAVVNNSPGIVTIGAAVVGTGYCINGTAAALLLGGGTFSVEWRVAFPVLSDGADRFALRIGLGDDLVGNDFNDAVYFENNFDVHGDNEWRGATAATSVRTKLDLNVLPVAGTYQRLKLVVNAAGTSVQYQINDVVAGTITTNIPIAAAQQLGYCAQFTKIVGVAARTALIDYVDLSQDFTTDR